MSQIHLEIPGPIEPDQPLPNPPGEPEIPDPAPTPEPAPDPEPAIAGLQSVA